MPAPTTVVFDLGKVLLDFDYTIAARRFAPLTPFSAEEIKTSLLGVDLLFRYERGELQTPQFFAEIQKTFQYRGTFDRFARDFGDIFTEIPEMIRLHARVRARRLPTYILSNTNEMAVLHIRRHYPFIAGFDCYVLSYEQRCMKPEPRIYEILEEMSGASRDQIVYIDDHSPNVQAALARGWQAVQHQTPLVTIARVEQLLGLG